jgi:hypothetical protein
MINWFCKILLENPAGTFIAGTKSKIEGYPAL